jgi:tRNA (guanosine-2'-O-)-methyltransferase
VSGATPDLRALVAAVSARHGPTRVVEVLATYLTDARKARVEAALTGRVGSVQIAVEDPFDPHNAAAIVRTAEGLGLSTVHLVRPSKKIKAAHGVTMGTHRWIDVIEHRDTASFIEAAHAERAIVAGAFVDGAAALRDVAQLDAARPLVILFGNEHSGLGEVARAGCDLRFRVPIWGMVESYNLSVCAALCLWVVLSQRRRAWGRDGDASHDELARRRALSYAYSVDPRLAHGMLAPLLAPDLPPTAEPHAEAPDGGAIREMPP